MQNNNINSNALFRSLIVYAVCIPLAIVIGYTLANLGNYRDIQSMGLIGALVAVLIFPLLMRWHYPLLVFGWTAPITLFFLPSHPSLFMFMVLVSLSISVVERILNREKHFVTSGGVVWPLLALVLVIIMTAELTGGIGLHSFGSDVYGGKKYVTLFIGILSFFAITARPIPKDKANLYINLFFAGSVLCIVSDFYPITPGPLRFIYTIFQAVTLQVDEMGNSTVELGTTRMLGISGAGGAVFLWLLARYGIRQIFFGGKAWRPVVFGLSFILIFMGGFRGAIIGAVMMFGIMFVLEKMQRTILMLPIVLGGITVSVALVLLAPHLPYTFQRSLAFLPLNISPEARISAESSSQWRLDMWQALLPQVPNYLLLGKGYSFSAQVYNEYMGSGATFKNDALDPAQGALALSSDFHSGPLSVVISFGIWGVMAWLWYWVAGFRVVWRNYRYGDPALRHINLFLFAQFISKIIGFLFIFGGIVEDVASFALTIGMSLAFNNGVARPTPQPAKPVVFHPRPALPARPAFQP